jgi:calcium-independent phospholipase A2-gamma
MAVLYMLHVETVLKDLEPPRIDKGERETLKRFAKWVPCKCKKKCGKEWNFINDMGLFRGGSAERKCGAVQYLQNGSLRNLFSGADREALVQMREHWISS